jgi:type IV pilus assembly protein PilM
MVPFLRGICSPSVEGRIGSLEREKSVLSKNSRNNRLDNRGNMFDFKGLLPDTKRTVGLDIGSSAVKLVEVLDASEGYLLNNFSLIPLERGILAEGAIMDSNVLCDKIRRLFKTSGCKTKKVVVSLSGHKVIARKAAFQAVEEEELRQLINDEAGNYLPFDNVQDVSFDFQILGESEGSPGQMDVVLVAAKKDIVQSYVEVLEKAGLKPVIMDVDSFSLESMYEANYDFEESDVVVLVNIGASMTNINVVKRGGSIFTRDISMGGHYITESIQEKLRLTFDEAERIKIESPGMDVSGGSLRVDPLDHAEPLFAEIERSIDYFRSTHGGEYIKEVILSGGSAKINGIDEALTQRLNIETKIARPFQNLGFNKKLFNPAYLEEIGPVAAIGVGLALRRMGDR